MGMGWSVSILPQEFAAGVILSDVLGFGLQNSVWQTQHLQNYTFACAWGSELCLAFWSTDGVWLSDPSGVKQQRIPFFWLFASVEEIHLQHSCTVKCIPKRRTQCRGKLTAAGARSLSQQAVAPMDLPTSFLFLSSFSVLSKSLPHLSILVSNTDKFLEDSPALNSFSSNTTWLAFIPMLSTAPQSERDGSC